MRLVEKDGCVLLRVKVVPNSSRTAVEGWLGEALKVKVAQPAEGGKANRVVVELLAKVLGVASSQVAIVSGHTQALKVLQIEGMTAEAVMERFKT